MIQKIEIAPEKPLLPGDLIEIHFKTYGGTFLKSAQIALIDKRLENQPGFRILSWSIPDPHSLVFEIRILKTNPVPIAVIVIAGLIISIGIISWLVLDKSYQIIESPSGKIAAGGVGLLAIVAAIIIVVSLFSVKRK